MEKDVTYQGDTLFFSTRQGVDLFIQIFLRQPDRFQICDCFLFIEFLFADFVRKSQIVADGFSEQNRCLECVGNLLAVFGRFIFIQRLPLVAYFPFGTRKDRRNDRKVYSYRFRTGRLSRETRLFQRITDVIQNDFAVRYKTQMFHFPIMPFFRFAPLSFKLHPNPMQTPKTAVQVGNASFFYSITDSLFFC